METLGNLTEFCPNTGSNFDTSYFRRAVKAETPAPSSSGGTRTCWFLAMAALWWKRPSSRKKELLSQS